MFKKFFDIVFLPFKSDKDLEDLKYTYPKATKVAKVIKKIFTVIDCYISLWNLNKMFNLFGMGFKHFPDITKIFCKGAKAAATI